MKSCKLNPKIFDKDRNLQPEVRDLLLKVSIDVIKDLNEEYGIDLDPNDVVFMGSLTGPNWDDLSDVDLHFLVDYDSFNEESVEFAKALLDEYRLLFNENEYSIYGHPLEIFFQDKAAEIESPGVYDVAMDKWMKEPDCIVIKATPEQKAKADEYLTKINEFVEEWNNKRVSNVESFYGDVEDYMAEIKAYRQRGMDTEKGMYSDENIVFKLLRRNGALEKLSNLKYDIKKQLYSLYD